MDRERRIARASAAFLRACRLDVAVRKPGNVSLPSPGHGMQAAQFIASAEAAAGPLFTAGAPVGQRIEQATEATWAVAGCNTNLGIVLLCAPIAAAVEATGSLDSADALRAAIEAVLAELGLDDSRAAFRAIARANPGGLGRAEAQDVHAAPTVGLRDAMVLAAPRDRIARQYANGYADLFETALPVLQRSPPEGPGDADQAPRVQRVFLEILSTFADSHIVRKHGEALAQTVMSTAQGWRALAAPGADPGFAAWDESLKAGAINPGTSADLTVAALLIDDLLANPHVAWHGTC